MFSARIVLCRGDPALWLQIQIPVLLPMRFRARWVKTQWPISYTVPLAISEIQFNLALVHRYIVETTLLMKWVASCMPLSHMVVHLNPV